MCLTVTVVQGDWHTVTMAKKGRRKRARKKSKANHGKRPNS